MGKFNNANKCVKGENSKYEGEIKLLKNNMDGLR